MWYLNTGYYGLTDLTKIYDICLDQECTTQMWWRAKKLFNKYLRAKIDIFFNWKGISIKQISWMHIILGLTGQIKTFRVPSLARESYVVHASYKQIPDQLIATCLYYWVEMCKNAFLHECKIEFVIFVYLKSDKLYFLIRPGRIVGQIRRCIRNWDQGCHTKKKY